MTPVSFVCPKCHAKYKAKQTPAADLKLTCQKCQTTFHPAEHLVTTPAPPPQPTAPQAATEPEPITGEPVIPDVAPMSAPTSVAPEGIPLFVADDDRTASVLEKVTKGKAKSSTKKLSSSLSKSKKSSSNMVFIGGALLGVIAVIGIGSWAFLNTQSEEPKTQEAMQRPVASSASPAAAAIADRKPTDTPRTPIVLQAMPAGLRLIVHVRPSELLEPKSDEISGDALKFLLSESLGKTIESAIHRPIDQVDDLLIGVLLGPVGSEPDFAYRVQLKDSAKPLDPSAEFNATNPIESQRNLFGHNGHVMLVRDKPHYTVAPERFGAELVNFQYDPAFTDPDLEAVLKMTDDSKPLTVVGKFEDLLTHAPQLVGVSRADVLEWLGRTAEKNAEMFVAETDLDDVLSFSAQMIPMPNVSALNVQKQFRQQLQLAPMRLVEYLRDHSAQTLGQQKLAGRFPAMLQATLLSTDISLDKNLAVVETKLPLKAWPNLLLASYSCWESDRPILRPEMLQIADNSNQTKEVVLTWQQRLVKPIEIEFKRSPLQDAFSYIADETKLTINIDGDALKLSGYTKNMPQNFSLGKVPALKAVQQIVAQYDAMCLIKGEGEYEIIVTTKPSVEALKILDLEELMKTPPVPEKE